MRATPSLSGADQGRPARLAAAEVVFHRRAGRHRCGPGATAARPVGSSAAAAASTAAEAPASSAQPAGSSALCRVNTGAYDELLGRTYGEIGTRRAQQSQMPGHWRPAVRSPACSSAAAAAAGRAASPRISLMDTSIPGQMEKEETSLFDGIDTTLAGISRFAGRESARGAHHRSGRDRAAGRTRAEGVRVGQRCRRPQRRSRRA